MWIARLYLLVRRPSDGLVPSCVYVDTVNNFKWTVANCNTYKLPELLCERYEDKCASDANTCAVKSSCINQLDGDLYCACKDSEQVSANGKTCETCQDGSCTFKVGPGTKSQAIPSQSKAGNPAFYRESARRH